ncbi:MAG: phage terminase large subunit, partial [Hyphomicrobiales bacterium]|nr:phage terminase large subunit [Hyphomicrobiales bacterium]
FRCYLWFVEAVQFQEFLRTTLMKEAARQKIALPAYPVTPLTDKALRIERLQVPIKDGLIRLHPSQQTLIDQLQQWNPDGSTHDDGPDALEMLWEHAVAFAGGPVAGSGRIAASGGRRSGGAMEGFRLR